MGCRPALHRTSPLRRPPPNQLRSPPAQHPVQALRHIRLGRLAPARSYAVRLANSSNRPLYRTRAFSRDPLQHRLEVPQDRRCYAGARLHHEPDSWEWFGAPARQRREGSGPSCGICCPGLRDAARRGSTRSVPSTDADCSADPAVLCLIQAFITIFKTIPLSYFEVDSLDSNLAPDWVLNDVNAHRPDASEWLLHLHRQTQLSMTPPRGGAAPSTRSGATHPLPGSSQNMPAFPFTPTSQPPPSPAQGVYSSTHALSTVTAAAATAVRPSATTATVTAGPAAPNRPRADTSSAAQPDPWAVGASDAVALRNPPGGAIVAASTLSLSREDDPGPQVCSREAFPPTPPASPEQVRNSSSSATGTNPAWTALRVCIPRRR